jgi:hypothetical protein
MTSSILNALDAILSCRRSTTPKQVKLKVTVPPGAGTNIAFELPGSSRKFTVPTPAGAAPGTQFVVRVWSHANEDSGLGGAGGGPFQKQEMIAVAKNLKTSYPQYWTWEVTQKYGQILQTFKPPPAGISTGVVACPVTRGRLEAQGITSTKESLKARMTMHHVHHARPSHTARTSHTERTATLLKICTDCRAPDNLHQLHALLAEGGINIDVLDDAQYTPLITVAIAGKLDYITALVEAGASLDTVGRNGATALTNAVQRGHTECVQYLVDAGADPDEGGPGTKTALQYAKNKDIAAILRRAGASAIPNHEALHKAARGGRRGAAQIRGIVERGFGKRFGGVDIELQMASAPHHTALMCAAESDNVGAARALISLGARLDVRVSVYGTSHI